MIIVGMVALIFISIGVGHMLASTISHPMWATLYCRLCVILFVLLVVFRQKLIFDPIARFISRLIVEPPKEAETQKKQMIANNEQWKGYTPDELRYRRALVGARGRD